MKTHIMRYLAGFAVCALLLGGLCLGGGAAASAAGSTLSLTAADKALLESSYQSLCGRLTERGYAQTSLTGVYNGMFVRDASIQAMAHLSRGDDEYARRLLEYMVRYHEELDMDYTVHAVAPLTGDAYGNTNAGTSSLPQNDGKNGFYADGTPTALYQTKAPNNRCAFTIVPSVSSVHSIRLYMNAAADTTVYLTDSYTGDLAAARGKAAGGTAPAPPHGAKGVIPPDSAVYLPGRMPAHAVMTTGFSGGLLCGCKPLLPAGIRQPPLCKGRWHGVCRDGGIVSLCSPKQPQQPLRCGGIAQRQKPLLIHPFSGGSKTNTPAG